MNPDLLKEYIQKPAALNKESLTVLSELAEQFPYCQTVQMLIVKNLHNLNHFQYSLRLKLGAAYATDRKVLHALISNLNEDITQPLPVKDVSDTPVITLVSPQEAAREEKTALTTTEAQVIEHEQVTVDKSISEEIKNNIYETVAEQVSSKESVTEPHALFISNDKPSPETIFTEPKKLSAAEIVAARLAEITGIKQAEILIQPAEESSEDKIEAVAEEVNTHPETIIEEQEQAIEIIPAVDYVISSEAASINELEALTEQVKYESAPPVEESIPNTVAEAKVEFHSFSEWLKNKKEEILPIETTEEPIQEIKEVITEHPLAPAEAPPYKDLIERFIETEPRIQPARGTFYSPVNMARQSAVENDDIISETLAKIYYQQGNLHKALHMYEKLSLKYPEKIIFFAAQIETIKKSL